jgi:hypothetical protein
MDFTLHGGARRWFDPPSGYTLAGRTELFYKPILAGPSAISMFPVWFTLKVWRRT